MLRRCPQHTERGQVYIRCSMPIYSKRICRGRMRESTTMPHRYYWILLERKEDRRKAQKKKRSRQQKSEWKKEGRERRKQDLKLALWNAPCLSWKGISHRIHKHQTKFLLPVGTKGTLMSILNRKSLSILQTVGYLNICNLNKK